MSNQKQIEIYRHRDVSPGRSLTERNRLLFLMELDSIGSREEYERCLGQFITYLRLEFSVNELKAEREHINAYKNNLLLNKKNGKATINKKLSVISSYFHYLLSKDLIENNPCEFIRRYRLANIGTSVAITREEVEIIYRSMPQKNFNQLRQKTMVIILFETGLRISELLSIRISAIKKDFGDYILEVVQKGGKIHRVILNELSLSWVGFYLEEISRLGEVDPEDLFFKTSSGRKINRNNFSRALKKIAVAAGINSKIHPHTSRVTFIRQKYKEGMDIYTIRKKVGHSSVTTTERYLN